MIFKILGAIILILALAVLSGNFAWLFGLIEKPEASLLETRFWFGLGLLIFSIPIYQAGDMS